MSQSQFSNAQFSNAQVAHLPIAAGQVGRLSQALMAMVLACSSSAWLDSRISTSSTTPRTMCAIRTPSPATNRGGMSTFRSIVFSSIIAGFVIGLIVTAAQQFGTVPLILKAEVYEKAAETHQHEAVAAPQAAAAGHDHAGHDHASHDHGAEAWEPRNGFERNAYTAAANVLTAIGFALLLAGFFAIRSGATGETVSWHQGLM